MNRDILAKLYKIANDQNKALHKLALLNDENYAKQFIKSATSSWLANNSVNAKYSIKFELSNDSNYDYDIELTLAPATEGGKISLDVPEKYKKYMAQKILENLFLKSKKVKIDSKII